MGSRDSDQFAAKSLGGDTYAPLSAFERADFAGTFRKLQHCRCHYKISGYQVFLASGIGLPKDDVARSEIMSASINVVEKIRTEIRALEHELDRREKQEKGRF
jgi:hypothetical protein